MKQKKLNRILQQHRLWLESDGEKGEFVNLWGAELRGADLWGADLRSADLQGASLYDADLRHADLRHADLRGASFRGADLRGADLRGAKFSINIRDCRTFRYVKVTQDALPWLILHPRWAEWKDTVQILPS